MKTNTMISIPTYTLGDYSEDSTDAEGFDREPYTEKDSLRTRNRFHRRG